MADAEAMARGRAMAWELLEKTLDASKTQDLEPLQPLARAVTEAPDYVVGILISELALVATRAIEDAARRSMHEPRDLLARFCTTPLDGGTAEVT